MHPYWWELKTAAREPSQCQLLAPGEERQRGKLHLVPSNQCFQVSKVGKWCLPEVLEFCEASGGHLVGGFRMQMSPPKKPRLGLLGGDLLMDQPLSKNGIIAKKRTISWWGKILQFIYSVNPPFLIGRGLDFILSATTVAWVPSVR